MHENSREAGVVSKSIFLQRQHHQQGFGFCLRGGVEHGVGHFVSSVDKGSIAEAQGIEAGDQIICVDGLPLTTATHKEAVAFISTRLKLDIQIKRMGVIPIKKHLGESIEWIHCDKEAAKMLLKQKNLYAVERMMIDLGEDISQGLGCSICKGPPQRPGIFVQSIKAGGAAQRSGLQLGDQILVCNDMSFEGSSINFNVAVSQMRGQRCLDLLIKRGAGLELVFSTNNNDEDLPLKSRSQRRLLLEDETRLLQSQVQLERRKLEAEQERLRLEAMKLEHEKIKLNEEREKLKASNRSKNCSDSSSPSASSSPDISSLDSSSSGGGLATAIQTELRRRKEAAAKTPLSTKSVLAKQTTNVGANNEKKVNPFVVQHNDQHDQLMAEFRQVHRKLFNNSSSIAEEEDEQEEEVVSIVKSEVSCSQEKCNEEPFINKMAGESCSGNRSYDETLVKPTNKAPSESSQMSTFKPQDEEKSLASGAFNPGIPTPDYELSTTSADTDSPEPKAKINLHKDPRTKTFSKRHPPIEAKKVIAQPRYQQAVDHQKNVRFDVTSEAAIAAHDYRVAHATRKAIRYTSELHKALAVRSGLNNNVGSRSMTPSTSSEEDDLSNDQRRAARARSPKKYPAPPPPPPPPSVPKENHVMLPKNVISKGID